MIMVSYWGKGDYLADEVDKCVRRSLLSSQARLLTICVKYAPQHNTALV